MLFLVFFLNRKKNVQNIFSFSPDSSSFQFLALQDFTFFVLEMEMKNEAREIQKRAQMKERVMWLSGGLHHAAYQDVQREEYWQIQADPEMALNFEELLYLCVTSIRKRRTIQVLLMSSWMLSFYILAFFLNCGNGSEQKYVEMGGVGGGGFISCISIQFRF